MKSWKLRIREHSIELEQQKSDYRERIKHRLREPEPSVKHNMLVAVVVASCGAHAVQ
jgi:hypothetical protein